MTTRIAGIGNIVQQEVLTEIAIQEEADMKFLTISKMGNPWNEQQEVAGRK